MPNYNQLAERAGLKVRRSSYAPSKFDRFTGSAFYQENADEQDEVEVPAGASVILKSFASGSYKNSTRVILTDDAEPADFIVKSRDGVAQYVLKVPHHGGHRNSTTLNSFKFGLEEYCFREAYQLIVIKTQVGFEVRIASLESEEFVGLGDSIENAKSNLYQKIHRNFQQLYKSHQMQRSDAEDAIWQELARAIDVERYKLNRLSILKCFGQIAEIKADSIVFHWYGGDPLKLANDSLVGAWGAIDVGDWCDAVVERRSGDATILRAIFLGKSKPPAELSDEEMLEEWNALPNAELGPIE